MAIFRPVGKSGETPDTRREWNMQTMDPESLSRESATRCMNSQHGYSGAQLERCFKDYFKLCDILAEESRRCSGNSLEHQVLIGKQSFTEMIYYTPLYSRTKSEPEIQAELFCALKGTGLEPKMAVRGYIGNEQSKKKCIFDIVVFWPLNHRPLCIIECKKGVWVSALSTQKAKYERFNLPLIYCFRNNQKQVLREVVNLAQGRYEKDAPPSMVADGQWSSYLAALDETP